MGRWCRRVEPVDSEQEVPTWFRQIGATDLCFVGDKGKPGPPDWVIQYGGHTIAVEVTLLREKRNRWPRAMEIGIEDKLCELVETTTLEHGSPLKWQVSCEYDPAQPHGTMRTGKWENRALGILCSAASAAPDFWTECSLAKEKTPDYGRGVFLNVFVAPAKENSGRVKVSNGRGYIVDQALTENASSAIKHKVKKIRDSIARGERSQGYEYWWLVFDDEVVVVPILDDDQWKSINKEIQGCTGIDALSKVVLVGRSELAYTTRLTNRWYHAFWEDPSHPPLPPSPGWGSHPQE